MDDSDDVYRRPRDRRAFVDEELKRAGLSLTDPAAKLPSAKDIELAAFIGPPVPAWSPTPCPNSNGKKPKPKRVP